MRIKYLTARFPSRIQPWFSDAVVQSIKNGADVEILSAFNGDRVYSSIVDEYDLKSRHKRVGLYGVDLLVSAVRGAISMLIGLRFVKYYRMSRNPGRTYRNSIVKHLNILALMPYAHKHCSIIHSHSEVVGYRFLPLVKYTGSPFVVTFHGLTPSGVPGLSNAERREYLSLADLILVNTEFAKRQYEELGADPRKIKVLPQGVDVNKFKFLDRDSETECNAYVRLLSVGRLTRDKGHLEVIRSVRRLMDEGVLVRLDIVGQGPDKEELIKHVNDLGLSSVINIITDIDESSLIKKYSQADIFILASTVSASGWQETQGVVLQEAQASGALVVATKTGGIPECVDDGVNGFYVEDGAPEEIAAKIRWLIENKDIWRTVRQNARSHVEQHYDIQVVGRRMYEVYEVLAGHGG